MVLNSWLLGVVGCDVFCDARVTLLATCGVSGALMQLCRYYALVGRNDCVLNFDLFYVFVFRK